MANGQGNLTRKCCMHICVDGDKLLLRNVGEVFPEYTIPWSSRLQEIHSLYMHNMKLINQISLQSYGSDLEFSLTKPALAVWHTVKNVKNYLYVTVRHRDRGQRTALVTFTFKAVILHWQFIQWRDWMLSRRLSRGDFFFTTFWSTWGQPSLLFKYLAFFLHSVNHIIQLRLVLRLETCLSLPPHQIHVRRSKTWHFKQK